MLYSANVSCVYEMTCKIMLDDKSLVTLIIHNILCYAKPMKHYTLLISMGLLVAGCVNTATAPTITTTNSNSMIEPTNEPSCLVRETLDDSTLVPVAEVSAGDTYWEDDLIEVDATNLPDEPIVIGHTQAKWDTMDRDEMRAMVMTLLRTGVIRTFAHIEADVCLTEEEFWKDGSYVAHFTATHTYFTNEENNATYTMRVVWDPADRSVTVGPGQE